MDFKYFIAEHRKSLFLVKGNILYPEFVNLSNIYTDNIYIQQTDISKQFFSRSSAYINNQSDIVSLELGYVIACNMSSNKFLEIHFKFGSKYDFISKVYVSKIYYYNNKRYYIIDSELNVNQEYVYRIDTNDINYDFKIGDIVSIEFKLDIFERLGLRADFDNSIRKQHPVNAKECHLFYLPFFLDMNQNFGIKKVIFCDTLCCFCQLFFY